METIRLCSYQEYKAYRSSINSGDLITVSFNSGWFWKLVNVVTPSKYHHSAIALWLGDRLIVSENNPQANSMMRLSQYFDRANFIDVTHCPYTEVSEEQKGKDIFEQMKHRIPYSFWQLIVGGVYRLTGVGLPYSTESQICSHYVIAIYEKWGLLKTGTGIIDPSNLVVLLEKIWSRK